MRAGLSTIQQTLTPEAATVLNHSIAEASRRNHGQTTPLHVAATLLSSPTGFLRQACVRSHPNSSHPLQCRALELCFSVALERLPTAQAAAEAAEPPISNALMAALKRAQAHQRRGCPEQQQQPLLAVKVELEQLIISILDDPSVSRVMREASFSSPAVKAAIEQSLNGRGAQQPHGGNVNFGCGYGVIGSRLLSSPGQLSSQSTTTPLTNRNLYLNPRLQQGGVSNNGLNGEESNRNAYLNPRLQQGGVSNNATGLIGGISKGEESNRNAYLNPRLQQGGGNGSVAGQMGNSNGEESNRNVYLNPRLQQGGVSSNSTGQVGGNSKGEELKKVLEIMGRAKKKNPVLVGDSEPEAVVREFLKKVENREMEGDLNLKDVQVVAMDKGVLSDKNQIASKIEELGGVIESRIRDGGVILDLGDLKWLVEQPNQAGLGGGPVAAKQAVVSEVGRVAVVEMAKLVARFGGADNNNNKLWLIGTATCESYLRCQVYHSAMENDWDLQAVPIASRSPLPGMFPRLGTERLLSNPTVESPSLLKAAPAPLPSLTSHLSENLDPAQQTTFCPQCSENYEKELKRLAAIEKSFSEAKEASTRPSLPQWLQNAKLSTTDDKATDESQGKDLGLSKQKTQELQKKWRDTCLHLHSNFHQSTRPNRTCPPPLSTTSVYNPTLLSRPPFQPKLLMTKPLGETLQLNPNRLTMTKPAKPIHQLALSPPRSPVRTDLVLGTKEPGIVTEKANDQDQVKDLLGCISSEPNTKLLEKFSNALDADTYKKLLKGLMEKAWWQAEAASAVASAITRCRLGNGKKRGGGSRGDVWLLFTGPDRVGKKKMATVLADQICGAQPVMIPLGKRRDDEESDTNHLRGKTAVDRIAEAVRRNPFVVIVLEDIDEADMLMRGNIKRAIERGRLTDSHGREVGLGNAVIVVTGDWSTSNPDATRNSHRFVDEKKLASVAGSGWQLGLIVREKSGAKRRANWLYDEGDRPSRPRKEMGSVGLSLDLNLATYEDDKADGSYNSSDLTVDHEDGILNIGFSIASVPHDLASNVDDSIVFKPVDSAFVRREIKKTISVKFAMVVDEDLSIEVEDDVLEKIQGGLWHDRTSLEQWIENVLAPSFDELRERLPPAGDQSGSVVRLVVESDSVDRGKRIGNGDWLPSSILV